MRTRIACVAVTVSKAIRAKRSARARLRCAIASLLWYHGNVANTMPAALGEKCERALVAVLYVGSLRDAVRGNAHLSAASSVRSLGDNCTDFFVSVGLESAIHKGSHPALPSTSRQEAEQVLLALRPKWHAISEHPNATSAMSTSGSHDCVRGADFVQGNICVFGPSVERGRAADHGPPECAKPTCDYCAPTAMYPMYRRWGEAVRQLYAHEELRAWRYTYVVLMRPDIVVGGQLPSLQSNFSWPESGTVFVHSDQYLVASREDVSLLADLSVDGPTCASRAKMNAAVRRRASQGRVQPTVYGSPPTASCWLLRRGAVYAYAACSMPGPGFAWTS